MGQSGRLQRSVSASNFGHRAVRGDANAVEDYTPEEILEFAHARYGSEYVKLELDRENTKPVAVYRTQCKGRSRSRYNMEFGEWAVTAAR